MDDRLESVKKRLLTLLKGGLGSAVLATSVFTGSAGGTPTPATPPPPAEATAPDPTKDPSSIEERARQVRLDYDAEALEGEQGAEEEAFSWRNWRNGHWGNGHWRNWRNGWGNGGWNNWNNWRNGGWGNWLNR